MTFKSFALLCVLALLCSLQAIGQHVCASGADCTVTGKWTFPTPSNPGDGANKAYVDANAFNPAADITFTGAMKPQKSFGGWVTVDAAVPGSLVAAVTACAIGNCNIWDLSAPKSVWTINQTLTFPQGTNFMGGMGVRYAITPASGNCVEINSGSLFKGWGRSPYTQGGTEFYCNLVDGAHGFNFTDTGAGISGIRLDGLRIANANVTGRTSGSGIRLTHVSTGYIHDTAAMDWPTYGFDFWAAPGSYSATIFDMRTVYAGASAACNANPSCTVQVAGYHIDHALSSFQIDGFDTDRFSDAAVLIENTNNGAAGNVASNISIAHGEGETDVSTDSNTLVRVNNGGGAIITLTDLSGNDTTTHTSGSLVKITGTSVPRLVMRQLSTEGTNWDLLIDDQVDSTSATVAHFGNRLNDGIWWAGGKTVINGEYFQSGSQSTSNFAAGAGRVGEAVDRLQLGDYIAASDGTNPADSRIRRSAANEWTIDNFSATKGTLKAGQLFSFANAITDTSGNIDAAKIGVNTVPTARLGSGTANSTTFLRGDNTWATPATSTPATLACTPTVNGATVTGNSAAQAMMTCAVPSIPDGKCIRATVHANGTWTAVAKTFSWTYGSTTVTYASTSSAGSNVSASAVICNNAASHSGQQMSAYPLIIGATILGSGFTTAAENSSGALSLTFNMNAPGTESGSVKTGIVELLQ